MPFCGGVARIAVTAESSVIWRNIQYDFPEAALLLFVVLAICLGYVFLYRFRQRVLNAFASPEILEAMIEPRLKFSYWITSFLICLTWVCGVLAIMGPKGNEHYISPEVEQATKLPPKSTVRQKAHDVIFLVDASASMSVEDTRTGKSRLDEAKEIVDEIISHLHGESISLHVFTSATIGLAPSTTDYLFVRLMVDQIGVNEGETEGTDILQAMSAIRKLYYETPSVKRKTLILLSDGGDTKFENLKGQDREQYLDEILHTVQDADAKHLRVVAVGLGSKEGKEIPNIKYQGHPIVSSLDTTILRRLSDSTGGQVYFDRDASTLQIVEGIVDEIAKDPAIYEEKVVSTRLTANQDELLYDYYFQIPLSIAIVCLALSLLIPQTLRRIRRVI